MNQNWNRLESYRTGSIQWSCLHHMPPSQPFPTHKESRVSANARINRLQLIHLGWITLGWADVKHISTKTIVVKYGGVAMKSEALQASVIADIVLLSCVGLRIVFVHGGGPEINQWLGKLSIKPNFFNGLRVTDASTMEIVSMVLVGKVNKHLVALINKAGATAVGLSGIDGRILTARTSPKAVQLGFVGDIASIDLSIILPLVDNNHIPVIASVAADPTGQPYNINADTAAGELAAALGAEKLILLTDVAGILEDRDDPGSLVKEIDIKGGEEDGGGRDDCRWDDPQGELLCEVSGSRC